jgi:predicted DNA-binding transcriptional regulator YafY
MAIDFTQAYVLTYIDAKGQCTSRRIKPIEWADAQTLVAYCFLRRDFRHFLVDRVVTIVPTLLTTNAQDEVEQAMRDRWVTAETF